MRCIELERTEPSLKAEETNKSKGEKEKRKNPRVGRGLFCNHEDKK